MYARLWGCSASLLVQCMVRRVVCDRIPLVGGDLAELEEDQIAYAEVNDVRIRYTPEGYAGPDDSGIVRRAQHVGQALRSHPLFI